MVDWRAYRLVVALLLLMQGLFFFALILQFRLDLRGFVYNLPLVVTPPVAVHPQVVKGIRVNPVLKVPTRPANPFI